MITGRRVAELSYEAVQLELLPGDILRITLARPDELNAVNAVMHDELVDLFGRLAEVYDLGAAIVTGAGRAFCAGGDLDLIVSGYGDPAVRIRQTRGGVFFARNLLSIRCPLIAAVNGPAVGLGATLALLSDIVVVSRTAWLADPHVKVGLVAGDGGTLIWPALLGPNRAKEFLMRGSRIPAEEAGRLGLVNHVVEPDAVEATATDIALGLSRGAREAIAGTKIAVNAALLRDVDQALGLSVALEAHSWTSPDIVEGVASLREKREPRWPSSRSAWEDPGPTASA